MVGAIPRSLTYDRARGLEACVTSKRTLRRIAPLLSLVLFSLALAQCGQGQAPGAGGLAANAQATNSVPFDERFPKPQFRDRFPAASESFGPRQASDLLPARADQTEAQTAPASYQVASLEPRLPYAHPARGDETALVSLKSSAFPYFGNNPRNDEPFLDISRNGRRGHRGLSGKVFWQDETFNDSRVLMHIPEKFDIRKPGVIVVFFHGNGATLERDVRERQLVPRQITESGANAVLLAPQLAVDAADSSAGKFWQPGGLKRFVTEAADYLALLYGDPHTAKAFANMPVVIVGYSGGFLPTAWSLAVGGLDDRVRGVFLLDAVYGELDKFASWIENNGSGFFVSSYTHYTARHDEELMRMLKEKGIAISHTTDGPLKPGSVVFVETPGGVTHRDYVTRAWTKNPVEDVLEKMAASPSLTKLAAGAAPPAANQ
jgi:hypothetical protein